MADEHQAEARRATDGGKARAAMLATDRVGGGRSAAHRTAQGFSGHKISLSGVEVSRIAEEYKEEWKGPEFRIWNSGARMQKVIAARLWRGKKA